MSGPGPNSPLGALSVPAMLRASVALSLTWTLAACTSTAEVTGSKPSAPPSGGSEAAPCRDTGVQLAPTNRIDTVGAGVCAVFGSERQVFCWGYHAQFCGPRTCAGSASVELPRCVGEVLSTDDPEVDRCATRPLPRPLRGVVRLWKTGPPVCVGKADGETSCVFRDFDQKDVLVELEWIHPTRVNQSWSDGALILFSDGSLRDRGGWSKVLRKVTAETPRVRIEGAHARGSETRVVTFSQRFRSVRNGFQHWCGIGLEDGGVYCWGEDYRQDSHGALGLGDVRLELCESFGEPPQSPEAPPDDWCLCTDTPQRLQLPGPAREIAIDAWEHCAVLESGAVWCWGEVPDGTPESRGEGPAPGTEGVRWADPEEVAGLSRVQSVTLGDAFACALRDDRSVWCWGSNDYGNLGDGTQASRLQPRAVAGLPRATELSAGGAHVCAITEDRALWCWGDNSYGQLGNGTFDGSSVPIQAQPPGTLSPIWQPEASKPR